MMNDDDVVAARASGRETVEELRSSGALDALFERLDAGEIEMTGSQGLLPALLKAEADRAGAEFLDLSAVVPVAHGADGLHYTPEDHERVAKAVAQKLRTMRR